MIKIVQLLYQIIVKKEGLINNQCYLSGYKNLERGCLRKTLKRMLFNKRIHIMRALQLIMIIFEGRKITINLIELNLSKTRKRKISERRDKTSLINKVDLLSKKAKAKKIKR